MVGSSLSFRFVRVLDNDPFFFFLCHGRWGVTTAISKEIPFLFLSRPNYSLALFTRIIRSHYSLALSLALFTRIVRSYKTQWLAFQRYHGWV